MKNQIAISTLAAWALMFAVTSAEAGNRQKGKKMRGDRMAHVIKQLDLTVEQQAALKKVRTESRRQKKAAKTELRALRKQQRAAWQDARIDRAKAVKLQQKINKLHGKIAVSRVEMRFDILDTLTAEQRTALKELKTSRTKDGKRRGKYGKNGKAGKRGYGKTGRRGKADRCGLDKRAKRDRVARPDRRQHRSDNRRPAPSAATR